jgi:O-antigen ligase
MMIVSVVLLKIKLRWVLGVGALTLFLVFYKWDSIQMELARNKEEHTTEQFDQRIQSAANVSTDASNLERINRWSCAIEMFKEKPIMGFGLGTFAFEYARFQEPENLTIISTNFGDLGNAHSEYLSALSETGLPGLLLFLGFVIAVFYTTIRNIQKARKDNWELFIYSCGILFSLSTYFIHAFLNNFLDTDKAAVPVFVMLAIVMVIEKKLSAQPEAGI